METKICLLKYSKETKQVTEIKTLARLLWLQGCVYVVCECVCASTFNYETVCVSFVLRACREAWFLAFKSQFYMLPPFNSWEESVRFSVIGSRNSRLRNNQPLSHAFESRLWKLNIKTLLSCFFWHTERPKLRTVGRDNPINEVLCFSWSVEPAHDCEMSKWPLCPRRCQNGSLVGSLASWHLVSDQQECGMKSSFKEGAKLCLCFLWEKTWKMSFYRNTAGLSNYTIRPWQVFLSKQLNPRRLRNVGSLPYNGGRKGKLQYSDSEGRVLRNLRILVKLPSHPHPQFFVR